MNAAHDQHDKEAPLFRLIRASAGTGKTYQLSGHALSELLKGAAPSEILATTFTRKAAGEILGRVLTRLADGAQDIITLQKKAPEDKQKARGAIGRRDAWFARNAKEAVIVWDNDDADVGRLVRSMQDALGELDVWVLDV